MSMQRFSMPFETKLKLTFFISTSLLGLLAMIQPELVLNVLGFLLGAIGLILLIFFGIKLFQYYETFQRYQPWMLSQFFMVMLLVFIFIFIPAQSLSTVVALLTMLALVGFAFFKLYLKARFLQQRITTMDWALGIGAFGLALLVLFNLQSTPKVIMFFIGGVLFYVSLMQIFKVLLDSKNS